MKIDVRTCNDPKVLKEELKNCPVNNPERRAIIEWKLKQMGQM
jgi:hypothetical protein